MKKGNPVLTYLLLVPFLILAGLVFGLILIAITSNKQLPQNILDWKKILEPQEIMVDGLTIASPNGKKIAFATIDDSGMKNSTVWVVNSDGTSVKKILKPEAGFIGSIGWIDSTNLIVFQLYPNVISKFDVNNLEQEVLIAGSSTEGSQILFPSIGYRGEVFMEIKDDKVFFENNKSIPESIYSVGIYTKKVEKESQKDMPTIPSKLSYNIPHFSQRDPAWEKEALGSCEGYTIHSAGCAVVSAAMMLKYFGINVTPKTLNTFLSVNDSQGYIDGCYLKWYAPVNLQESVKLKGAYFGDFSLERINYELSIGNVVLLGFNKVPFTNVPHWVVLTGRDGDTYFVNDPWELNGDNVKTLADFGGKFDHIVVYTK